MFREITVTKQAESGPKRRWYQSDYFDLFVFYYRHSERADVHAEREFVAIQLCYDIRRKQRSLEWKKESGFSHHRVDKGGDTLDDHGASASLLEKGGEFDANAVIGRFMRESEGLPPLVRKLVMEKLAEYARELASKAPAPQGPVSEPQGG
ncbi:MAG TPA: hypothetical protein VGN52_12860 [Burkholderiales bacterium]|jgi:hypothetical protein